MNKLKTIKNTDLRKLVKSLGGMLYTEMGVISNKAQTVKESLVMLLGYSNLVPCDYTIEFDGAALTATCTQHGNIISNVENKYWLHYDALRNRVYVDDEQGTMKYFSKHECVIAKCLKEKFDIDFTSSNLWQRGIPVQKIQPYQITEKDYFYYKNSTVLDVWVDKLCDSHTNNYLLGAKKAEPLLLAIIVDMLFELDFIVQYAVVTFSLNPPVIVTTTKKKSNIQDAKDIFLYGSFDSGFIYDIQNHRILIPSNMSYTEQEWNDMVRYCFKKFGVAITTDIIERF